MAASGQNYWPRPGSYMAASGQDLTAPDTAVGPLLRAERPNHLWAIDFQFDETADRRRLKLCNIVDEHTREALAMRVARTCTAEDAVAVTHR